MSIALSYDKIDRNESDLKKNEKAGALSMVEEKTQREQEERVSVVKEAAVRLMHLIYREGSEEEVLAFLAPEITWIGAGERQWASGKAEAGEYFRWLRKDSPDCLLLDEQYEVSEAGEGLYLCRGLMWFVTDAGDAADGRLRQRVSLLFRWTENGPLCIHIHCSHPYTGMWSSIFTTVPCGILRFRQTGDSYELLSINPAGIKLLGYENQTVEMRNWTDGIADTVLPEDHKVLLDSYEKMKKVGDRVWLEYRVRWRDGSIHWLRGSNAIVGELGDAQIVQRMFLDVTESKLLEEQLKREREMYRLAMESSSDILYEYTSETDTMAIYVPAESTDGECRVKKWEFPNYLSLIRRGRAVHPLDIPKVAENICRGRAESFDCRFRMMEQPEDGEYRWYFVTGKRIERDFGHYRIVGTIRDIHEEKQAYSASVAELHISQSVLQAVNGRYLSIYYVDLLHDWSYQVRLPGMREAGSYERRGEFIEELENYIRDQVEERDQKRLREFLTLDNLESLLNANHDTCGIDYCEVGKGEKRWLRLEFYLAAKEKGRIRDVIITFRNVTEERRQELEHRQKDEKAREALAAALEAARKANQAKSDFLSRMSHDIRTPMNAVMGMTAIAKQNLSDPERLRDCLQKIEVSSEHLLNLINEVLDMSKIENGGTVLQEEPFCLRKAAEAVIEMIRPQAEARKQLLESSIQALKHESVIGDSVRLQQILLNLLSNAVKYTEPGGKIQVSVTELLTSRNGVGCYQIVVKDTGIGMSAEFLQKLFKPFERAEDSRVSKTQGTGLGMPITKNLVEMMNGTIEVQSRAKEGTCFTVTLYLKLAEHPKEPVFREKEPVSIPGSHTKRILLTEDNDLNREIARELLEIEELCVDEAVNGQEAVEKFKNSPVGYYDLVLMDIQMPVMNGHEAARAIRQLERPDAGKIPIIALTANAFADDIYAARQAGMNEHLSKPLNMDRLREMLGKWLS